MRWLFSSTRAEAEGPPIVPLGGWSAPLVTLTAAAMAFLAVLALAGGLAAGRLAEAWRGDRAGLATVQISAPRERLEARIERTLAVLRTTPGITDVRVLSETEHEALLAPWLGATIDLSALPAPRLIEVALEGAGPDAARLNDRLERSVGGAVYDDHGAWRVPLVAAAARLEVLAWSAVALIIAAAAAMVALTARASLSANLETVRIVRLIGAEDGVIARAVETRLALRGLAGGVLGTGAAALAFALVPEAPAGVGLALMAPLPVWVGVLAAVPLVSGLIAWVTARASVRLVLARMV
ncbi:MAG: cell division protein FtsX [Pseudomonadota bacterium]